MTLLLIGATSRAAALGLYGVAAWRGDAPVRIAAAGMAAATLAMPLIQDHIAWGDPGHRLAILDFTLFAGLIGLTLARPRYWLVLASACQLLSAGSDLLTFMLPVAAPRAWLHVTAGFTWGVTACIVTGAFLTRRNGSSSVR